MNVKQLWTKLFSKKNEVDKIALHVSGATVRHKNPFENIEVPRNKENISKEFIDKWVVPYYLNIHSMSNFPIEALKQVNGQITPEIVAAMLGEFNWRTRLCGAFFAAINNFIEFEDIIGRHLLKSEVCYAGTGYCFALAIFNTTNGKTYLTKYLDYYLDRNDLWFDQADAYSALLYMDKNKSREFDDKWKSFVADKPNWDLERSYQFFNQNIDIIKKIRELASEKK